MPVLNHIHQYIRVKRTVRDGKPFLFMCAHPDCSHRNEKKFIEGKHSICNKCGSEFVLTREDLRRSKPVCVNCSQTKEAKLHRQIREGVSELFPEEKQEITTL